jgi:hypothetical protein
VRAAIFQWKTETREPPEPRALTPTLSRNRERERELRARRVMDGAAKCATLYEGLKNVAITFFVPVFSKSTVSFWPSPPTTRP